MVDPRAEEILIRALDRDTVEVVRGAGARRQRVALEQRPRDRVDAPGGNRAVGEWRPSGGSPDRHGRGGIVDGREASGNRLREDPLSLQQRGYRRDHRPRDVLPLPLVVDEEERAVPPDWSARHSAELVAPERRFLPAWGEWVARVERLVAHETEETAGDLVPARSCGQVDDTAVEPPELRGWAVRLDSKFLDAVDVRKERDLPRFGLEDRDAIEDVFVGAGATAVDAGQGRSGSKCDAGRQRRESDEAAFLQRQLADLLLRHHLAQPRALVGDRRRLAYHDDGFLNAAELERHLHRDNLASEHCQAATFEASEAVEPRGDGIGARPKRREDEAAAIARAGGVPSAGVDLHRFHDHGRKCRTVGVADDARYPARRDLCCRRRRQHRGQQQREAGG